MKKIIACFLLAACTRYTLPALAGPDTITARNIDGRREVLTICSTPRGALLLPETAPGLYMVTIDAHNIFNSEDDEIITFWRVN